jgi:hypothetical protein
MPDIRSFFTPKGGAAPAAPKRAEEPPKSKRTSEILLLNLRIIADLYQKVAKLLKIVMMKKLSSKLLLSSTQVQV